MILFLVLLLTLGGLAEAEQAVLLAQLGRQEIQVNHRLVWETLFLVAQQETQATLVRQGQGEAVAVAEAEG
jgi:hypothetical protein